MSQKMTDSELLVRIDERLKSLKEKFDDFQVKLEQDLVKKEDFQQVKDDVSWLKRFFWAVVGPAIAGFVTGAYSLVKLLEK